MDKCGIICEYNPFHNGHEYHLKKTADLGFDVICVMSGNFVQRTHPAVFDKGLRTRAALHYAKAVIELPAIFSTAPAEIFAFGAIKILSGIDGLTHISFGVETQNTALLEFVANIQCVENPNYKSVLHKGMAAGLSYPRSCALAATDACLSAGFDENECKILLSKPNNILAIEYLKAIKRLGASISPIYIERTDEGYHSEKLKPPYASASALRNLLETENPSALNEYIPAYFLKEIAGAATPDYGVFNALMRLAVLECDAGGSLQSPLLAKLKKAAATEDDLDKIILAVKSKCFTYAKIKRLIFGLLAGVNYDNIFDIYKTDEMGKSENISTMSDINSGVLDFERAKSAVFYSRLLGVQKDFSKQIPQLGGHIITRISEENNLFGGDDFAAKVIKTGRKLDGIYSAITHSPAPIYSIIKI